ncbi:MAG: lysylphosphatidylglycerol synthase transmembrane domain-containing protein [Myxococcota bacterium]
MNAAPGGPEPPPQPVSREPPGLLRRVALVTVLGVLVFAGLGIYGDARALAGQLGRYRWSAFALGLLLATLNYGLRWVRWELYLRALGVRGVALASSARIFVAGFVMSVTPGKVGEVLKSVLLEEAHGVPLARTAPIVVAERITDLLGLSLLTALGALAVSGGSTAAAAGIVLVVALWLAVALRPLGESALRLADAVPGLRRLGPALREAYESLRRLVAPGPFLGATALSVLAWGLECVSLHVILQGFDEPGEVTLLEATFAYGAPTIVGAVALLPGGVGLTEAGMTGALLAVGVPSTSVATAATILCRLATLWWAVLLGVVAYLAHRRARARTAQGVPRGSGVP